MQKFKVLEKLMCLKEIEEYLKTHTAYRLVKEKDVANIPVINEMIPLRRYLDRLLCKNTTTDKLVTLNKSIKVKVYLVYTDAYLEAVKASKSELQDPEVRSKIENVLKILEMRNINMGA